MSRSTSSSSLVVRRLYRSLLLSAKPFTPPSPDAAAFTCLLSRTGVEDFFATWNKEMADLEKQSGKSSYRSLEKHWDPSQTLFRRLLREVITGPTTAGVDSYDDVRPREFLFPSQIDASRLYQIIRREFRFGKDSVSALFDDETRRNVAFSALKALNKKVELATSLKQRALKDPLHPNQAARNVYALPFDKPSSYLRSGAFLLAHPHLTGFFARSVICILSHKQDGGEDDKTYGLVINKINIDIPSGEPLTMADVIRSEVSVDVFEDSVVREGGPVQPSFQLVYCRAPGENVAIGGTLLPSIAPPSTENDGDQDIEKSLALDSDQEIYYQGDLRGAAQAVETGELKVDDVCFYVGASVWTTGQLESEVSRGVWIPCRAPTSLLVRGKCEHDAEPASSEDGGTDKKRRGKPPKEDMWLSMMCALGEDEAKLAHFVGLEDKFDRPLAAPCDDDIG